MAAGLLFLEIARFVSRKRNGSTGAFWMDLSDVPRSSAYPASIGPPDKYNEGFLNRSYTFQNN
jgi:hypothetical protein